MFAEKEIRNHDLEFYEVILPWINDMPDFRPLSTVNQMKKEKKEGKWVNESQNNWEVVYHELKALSYNEDHMNIINATNTGDLPRLLHYIETGKLPSDVAFSYPALVWIMTKISPKETLYPFLIASGQYLYIIPMKRKYLQYIRSLQTAITIRKNYSSLLPHADIIFVHRNSYIEPFYIYWMFAEGTINLKNIQGNIAENVARLHDMDLIIALVPIHFIIEEGSEEKRNLIYLLEECIAMDFSKAVEYILHLYTPDKRMILAYIKNTIQGKPETCRVLLNSISFNISQDELYNLLAGVKGSLDPSIKEILLTHPCTKNISMPFRNKNKENILWDCLIKGLSYCRDKLWDFL